MNAYRFLPAAGENAVEAWRPLDRMLHRWVLAHGGDALLATVAAWASLADAQGDVALPLDTARHGMPALSATQRAQLRASPLVATTAEQGVRAFVLDADDRFYLQRNHADEVAAAARICERRAAQRPGIDAGCPEEDLDRLFQGDRSANVLAQREAVRHVLGKRLFVLAGGPGTGKTTTVLRMLLMLQRRAAAPLTMRMAAPTGKAAQRLTQAVREGMQRLREGTPALPDDWLRLLDAMVHDEALTLHRLLGYEPWRNAFRHHARNPVAADVVVVDEASMIDLAMLRSLLDAISPEACLILVGDADQLSSVAAGSVLSDLVAAFDDGTGTDLRRLTHSFRAEQALVRINEAVRAGDWAALQSALVAAPERACCHLVDDEHALREQVTQWAQALAQTTHLRPTLPALDSPARNAAVQAALAALSGRQLLCALRETAFGTLALNALIESLLRRCWNIDEQATWYAGRAIIIIRNDAASGLFNGDVGVCLADAGGLLRVWFPSSAAEGGVRSFLPGELPAHECAFALTIHKSQGSEYTHTAIVLPPDPEHRMLSRQLLYTGVSRARQSVEIWSAAQTLQTCVMTSVQRTGGLRERINGQRAV